MTRPESVKTVITFDHLAIRAIRLFVPHTGPTVFQFFGKQKTINLSAWADAAIRTACDVD